MPPDTIDFSKLMCTESMFLFLLPTLNRFVIESCWAHSQNIIAGCMVFVQNLFRIETDTRSSSETLVQTLTRYCFYWPID